MKGFTFTLDLALATLILLSVMGFYFIVLKHSILEYREPVKNEYIDIYAYGFITAAEKSGVLEEAITNSSMLEYAFNNTQENMCFYAVVYKESNLVSGGGAEKSIYKEGCGDVSPNARLYYRHVVVNPNTPLQESYVYKFWVWIT